MTPQEKHIQKIGAMPLNCTEAGKILGKGRITGGRMLTEIRKALKRPQKGCVLVKEFSEYTKIPLEICLLYVTF